ncbi:EF-hand domain pair [Artemisia annua]|uniref:EF-hand domain pair n=1 Tax=Artemisia annua TaxID=35608 RepID=A0A2U1LHC4_ARTAN|nr:EF-hand domain pair [Artemisia annua]
MDQFELYFRRADLDHDGRISGAEAVSFFKASGLPTPVLAQIWNYADQKRTGFLGREEFNNALKLVTVAQSKRDLTADIVKAALHGPASSKIPAPQINLAALPPPQSNPNTGPPAPQIRASAPVPSPSMGVSGPQPQGYPSQQTQGMRPHGPPMPNPTIQPRPGVSQGLPSGPTVSNPRPSTSPLFNDWLGERNAAPAPNVSTQPPSSGLASSGWTAPVQPRPQAPTSLSENAAPKPNGQVSAASGTGAKVISSPVAGNGSLSSSAFGDDFFSVASNGKPNSLGSTSSAPGLNVSSVNGPTPAVNQFTNKPSQFPQVNVAQQPTSGQIPKMQPNVRPPHIPAQNSSTVPVRAVNVPSTQPWPKMTQSNVQQYTKVFVEVDKDRDGKITGEEARTLFLSWRLPREILKQVWELSDQDNDSMLSLKEFCIALYLMERYREGRPLPKVLPAGVIFEGTPLPPSGQAPTAYSAPVWRPEQGALQGHRVTALRQVSHAAARPPRPVPLPIEEDVQPRHQKPKVPVLEKHLVDQLSNEEQSSLNSKFQEATEADKKVVELEKEILEARQKIEFYRSKMQEIVLYKSRCDTRLNEITERVSSDKREVEILSKKYEDKYKQSGDVASKLTLEEATFRDIQAKKMELYKAIVKLDQDGKPDDIQVRVDQIQADLEEQVKALNERCKMYGLRGKPTLLVELPFGWQTGIQEGAADWDEDWDKFEDEGYTFVKDLTLDVQNVIAPPKPKSLPVKNKSAFQDEKSTTVSSLDTNTKPEKISSDAESVEQHKDDFVKTPPDSPASVKSTESPSKIFRDSSPRAVNTKSESVFLDEGTFDLPSKATFDSHDDSEAAWDFTTTNHKDMDEESFQGNSLFDSSDNWGLNPIRTEMPKKSTFTFDSVPSTPAYSYAGSPPANNLFHNTGPFASSFDESVPSTPAYSNAGSPRRPFTSVFADSVPSTPMFANDGPEDNSFNNFSRFDSFSTNSRDSFARFDSFRSTAQDSEVDQSLYPSKNFTRFDSMQSTADSDFGHSLFQPRDSFSRFDSMQSTNDSYDNNRGFSSFDDADPFGSYDPFKTSVESETPRRDSVDGWKAF